jgi:hypothetical protein
MFELFFESGNKQEFENIDAAIDAGKIIGQMFFIRYGNMICCIWSKANGLAYSESYKRWYEDQQQELARVGGWDER